MVTPKLIYYVHKKYSDGSHPIIIQIIINGKPKRKVVARALPEQWSSKFNRVNKKHPFCDQINATIDIELNRTYERIKDGIDPLGNKNKGDVIFTFIQDQITKHEAKKQSSVVAMYKIMVRDFIGMDNNFPGKTFQEIESEYIEDLYYYLISDKVGNSLNMAAKKISRIKTLWRRAKLSKIKTNDPFGTFDMPKTKTIKRKLNIDEFNKLKNVDLSSYGLRVNISRDLWICAFYLRGIRIGDLLTLKPQNIIGDRLSYVESKTGNERRIRLPKESIEIINKYLKNENKYIFPLLNPRLTDDVEIKKEIKRTVSKINMGLDKVSKYAGIDKKLTTHIARHTFSKMAIDKIKNPRISQGLVGHSSLAVHQKYIEDLQDNDELDNAADEIFE